MMMDFFSKPDAYPLGRLSKAMQGFDIASVRSSHPKNFQLLTKTGSA